MGTEMSLELAREMARQGEVRLAALVTIGVAADSRANTLCGIFFATATGVAAALVACLGFPIKIPTTMFAAGIVVAATLFVAAIIAAISGRPRLFGVPGATPDKLRQWWSANAGWRDEASMLDATAIRYSTLIEQNKHVLEHNGKLFLCALMLAAMALPIGAFVAFAF